MTELEGRGDGQNVTWALNRITDAEQNIEAIRADLARCQSQVNDQSTEKLAQHITSVSDRLRKLRRIVMREDALTPEEQCLLAMYRYVRAQEAPVMMVLRADSSGQMTMERE